MKIWCIGDADTVLGFRLGGVEGRVVASPAEAAEALDAVLADPEVGLVILGSATADGIRRRVDRWREERATPLLVEMPRADGTWAPRRGLADLIREAIGLKLESTEGG